MNAWAIKLGSGGVCVPFCERHGVVGLGWRDVDTATLGEAAWSEVEAHVRQEFDGKALGQLWRFARECSVGDFVLYYDPPKKHVRVTRVVSPLIRRDFEMESAEEFDIWQCRKVEYPTEPIPILDFPGGLKGSVLGPRMSFWRLTEVDAVAELAGGRRPGFAAAADPDLEEAYRRLRELVLKRAIDLNAEDWEIVVADYFRSQGAHVEGRVGGNRAVVDVEARFSHGEIGSELWRVQVKRYQSREVDWAEIEECKARAGEARFCFFSAFGFTDDARTRAAADPEQILLLDAGDLVRFLLGGGASEPIRRKLSLPRFRG